MDIASREFWRQKFRRENLHLLLSKNPAECGGAIILLLLALLCPSFVPLLMLLISFIIGTFGCHFLLKSIKSPLVPNLLVDCCRDKKTPGQDDELTILKKICPVCGKANCSRHRPELNILALQPWKNMQIPSKVDAALEEFLNQVLKEFIFTWYRDLSQDEAFLDEIRTSLRFIISVLFRRLLKADIPTLVTDNVIKTAIQHLHLYLEIKRKAPPGADIEQLLLDHYDTKLHVSMRSRRVELDYLRFLAEKLFPHLLPLHSLQCTNLCVLLREILSGAILLPVVDVLADPDMINTIIWVFLDKSPPLECTDLPSPNVPFLGNFSQLMSKSDSCLRIGLTNILNSPQKLFPFMQFLKREASVNVLQFYLSADEFNRKVLMPELTPSQLEELHVELRDLYRVYCDPASVDRIQFDDSIVTQLKQICDGPPEGVIKLQTTTPLFLAFDHAYALLEESFLPLFHQSDDYYKLLCGERLPTGLQRGHAKSKRATDALKMSRMSTRIKSVFKANTVEGNLPDDIEYAEETDASSLGSEDLVPMRGMWDSGMLRNMSAWRITVPSVMSKSEPDNHQKYYYVFVIEVRRVDVLEDDFEASNWKVERKYPEFYVLESKLTEFHGEFEDIHLPPKKSFGTKKREFLESQRPLFEQYLQKLFTLPTLRGSELLYTFLTSDYEFTSSFLPDINLGKIVKSGAMKLVKERGQHLDTFLHSFLQSTEVAKPRPLRWSDQDSDTISISSEKMANALFENNANLELNARPIPIVETFPKVPDVPVENIYDTIIYLVEHVYQAPVWVHHGIMAFRLLFRNTMDTYVDWYIGYKLQHVLQEHRVVHIVQLLQDAVFGNDPPRTEEQKQERKEQASKLLKETIPDIFARAMGRKNFDDGTNLLLEALQYPRLNKQLSYMLLDQALIQLFPELIHSPKIDKSTTRLAR